MSVQQLSRIDADVKPQRRCETNIAKSNIPVNIDTNIQTLPHTQQLSLIYFRRVFTSFHFGLLESSKVDRLLGWQDLS